MALISYGFSSFNMNRLVTVDALQYCEIYRTERNELKMVNFDRFIVPFNISIGEGVNRSMITDTNTTSDYANM